MVLSNLNNSSQEQRIRNLLSARKRYSDYTKDQCKNGSKERAELRCKIKENQQEIQQIREELDKYRREYKKIINTMGKAHEDAVFRENEEDIISDLIKQRNKRVKSRAELVLLEEVHRAKLIDLKKQLENEKILKRRRDVFRSKSPSTKVRINNEFRGRLDELKHFEELVQQEINQLRQEKEQSRLKRISLDSVKNYCKPQPVKPTKVLPQIYLKPKFSKNAQVQTSICINSEPVEPIPPENIEPMIPNDTSSSSLLRPSKQINSNLEELLAIRVVEKLNKMKSKVPVQVKPTTTITKDAAINTSCQLEEEQSISDFSQTCYLPLPSANKENSISKKPVESEKIADISDKDDRASSIVDLSLMNGINLQELVQKIQHIKNLVNTVEPPVVSSSENRKQKDKSEKLEICVEDRISPVSSISPSLSPPRSLSPTGLDSPPLSTPPLPSSPLHSPSRVPGLSQSCSSPCLSSSSSTSSDATIKKRDAHLSLEDVSFSFLSGDKMSMEQGRFGDDSLSMVQPRSLQVSIDFSQFSKLLNVDKDKLWADVLDLAKINRSTTFTKTPQRKYSKQFTQSTPKTQTTKGSVNFDCLTNEITINN